MSTYLKQMISKMETVPRPRLGQLQNTFLMLSYSNMAHLAHSLQLSIYQCKFDTSGLILNDW